MPFDSNKCQCVTFKKKCSLYTFEERLYFAFRAMKNSLDVSNLADSHGFFTSNCTQDETLALLSLKTLNYKKVLSFGFEQSSFIAKFAFVKSKCYSILLFNNDHIVKSKGSLKSSIKDIYHDNFLQLILGQIKFNCLFTNQEKIYSKNLHTYYQEYRKKVTDALILKRFSIDPRGQFTLPFGYHFLGYLRVAWDVLSAILLEISP